MLRHAGIVALLDQEITNPWHVAAGHSTLRMPEHREYLPPAATVAESVRPRIEAMTVQDTTTTRRPGRWITRAGVLLLLVALGGCAQSDAARPPVPAPRGHATSVPPVLVGYSSAAADALRLTAGEGAQLAGEMKHESPSFLTSICSEAGGAFANQFSAFQSVYLPPQARSVSHDATTGYKIALSATDECGMAADGNSKSQMKVALSDLQYGLWLLAGAQARIHAWSQPSG